MTTWAFIIYIVLGAIVAIAAMLYRTYNSRFTVHMYLEHIELLLLILAIIVLWPILLFIILIDQFTSDEDNDY